MNPKSPDFFCIGAQKAGTSWLRHILRQHPQVWMPPKNEMHYFDNRLDGQPLMPELAKDRSEDNIWRAEQQTLLDNGDVSNAAWWALHNFSDLDDNWYRSLFAFAPPESVTGDITPRYMLCSHEQIAQMNRISPDAKLLFLLRHPVERFWSQCKMKIANGSLHGGDAAAMRFFEEPIGRPRGAYSQAILRFCEVYPPENMLLVFQEGIIREPASVVQSIHAFLGLQPAEIAPSILHTAINQARDTTPLSPDLKGRLDAAYRSEINIMADSFGGYPEKWRDGADLASTPSVVQVSEAHVNALKKHYVERLHQKNQRNQKVFCLSMQRSGTTSVGDWLEAHGLKRAGSPTSVRLGWTQQWYEGSPDTIFDSEEFDRTEIFEDDPWWCPSFYTVITARYPSAKFILLERDPEEWFESLCRHSQGFNPGPSDVHARIYNREEELARIIKENTDLQAGAPRLLSIIEHRDHYIEIYSQHVIAVRAFFKGMPEKLLHGHLEDPSIFPRLCEFVGVQYDPSLLIPRSNASTDEMRHQLENIKKVGLHEYE